MIVDIVSSNKNKSLKLSSGGGGVEVKWNDR